MRTYGAGLFIVLLLGVSGFAAAGIASKVARFGASQVTTTGTGTLTLPTTAPTVPTEGEEGRGQEKVTLCHRPPGNPGNAHEITVGEPAVSAHLGHGDTLGQCPSETTTLPTTTLTTTTVGTTDSGADKVTICHRPPGNPDNARTITVGEPAASAHLGHGDTAGACPTQSPDSTSQAGGGNGKGKGKGKQDKAGKQSGSGNGQGTGNGQGAGKGQGAGNGRGNEGNARGRQSAPAPAAEPSKGKSNGAKPGKGKGPGGKPRLLSWIYGWVF